MAARPAASVHRTVVAVEVTSPHVNGGSRSLGRGAGSMNSQ